MFTFGIAVLDVFASTPGKRNSRIAHTCVILSASWLLAGSLATAQEKTEEKKMEAKASQVIQLWPKEIPAWTPPTEQERDTSDENSRLVAGGRVIRIGNVSSPELHVYPAKKKGSSTPAGGTVVIAPGGGYSILAWDLEGTEVAHWLQGIGVNAVVLKYRVPTRNEEESWKAPVQDIQRAVSTVRSGKIASVGKEMIGVLGFSAGGNASARALTAKERHYDAADEIDQFSHRPDFGVLVYPAWLASGEPNLELIDEIQVDQNTPPAFFAHAIDDRVDCMHSIALFAAMKQHGIPSSLHVFSAGGHGFGLRQAGIVTDHWPNLCESWLKRIEVIQP